MKKSTLDVTGMKCEGCAGVVRSALDGVEGVRRVVVSLDEARAEVVAEDDVEPGALAAAVEEAGYGAASSG